MLWIWHRRITQKISEYQDRFKADIKSWLEENEDIEILNNKDALIKNEKIRPKPTKPELLPLEVAPIKKKKQK